MCCTCSQAKGKVARIKSLYCKLLRDPLAEAMPLAILIFDTDSALFSRTTEGLSAMPVVLRRSVHMRIIAVYLPVQQGLAPAIPASLALCPAPRAKAFTGGTVLCTCPSGTAGTLKDRGASLWQPS